MNTAFPPKLMLLNDTQSLYLMDERGRWFKNLSQIITSCKLAVTLIKHTESHLAFDHLSIKTCLVCIITSCKLAVTH